MAYKIRIQRDLKSLLDDPIQNCKIKLDKNDLLTNWIISMDGPGDSIYEDKKIKLILAFNENYPFNPPTATFLSKIFHPNVDENGSICIDSLKKGWTPASTVSTILLVISSLLTDPNPEDPLNAEAAKLYKKNIKEYEIKAKTFFK